MTEWIGLMALLDGTLYGRTGICCRKRASQSQWTGGIWKKSQRYRVGIVAHATLLDIPVR